MAKEAVRNAQGQGERGLLFQAFGLATYDFPDDWALELYKLVQKHGAKPPPVDLILTAAVYDRWLKMGKLVEMLKTNAKNEIKSEYLEVLNDD